MLLNNYATFSKISKSMGQDQNKKPSAVTRGLTEVDRLYCSSLMILESSTTYEQDQFMGLMDGAFPPALSSSVPHDESDSIDFQDQTSEKNTVKTTSSTRLSSTHLDRVKIKVPPEAVFSGNMFKVFPVQPTPTRPVVSCLTQGLDEMENFTKTIGDNSKKRNSSRVKLIDLTIYLPDYTPMDVAVKVNRFAVTVQY